MPATSASPGWQTRDSLTRKFLELLAEWGANQLELLALGELQACAVDHAVSPTLEVAEKLPKRTS